MQAVFLDACGVLYRRQRHYHHLLTFLQREGLPTPSPAELQRIRAQVKEQEPAAGRDAKYDIFLTALGVTEPARLAEGRQVLAQEAAEITLFPGVADTLRTLKTRGFKLGVITNTSAPSLEKRRWLENCGIDVAFDSFIASCEIGVAKPHPRIYQAALAECRVSTSASLFVGHEAAELMGARAVGLKTIAVGSPAYAGADEFIDRFAELLTLPYLQTPSLPGGCGRDGSSTPLSRTGDENDDAAKILGGNAARTVRPDAHT